MGNKVLSSTKLRLVFLIGAFVALVFLVIRVVARPQSDDLEAYPEDPATDYEMAMARLAQVNVQEASIAGLNPVCHTTAITHGHKTERVIILMHGMTNCPAQFVEFAPLFYERGYNVLIPLMPDNGLSDLETDALKEVTADQLRDCCASMVDIARGFGEKITYLGLSVGGTMAAWVAQYRSDVDLAVLMAPSFTISRKLGVPASRVVLHLFSIMPNLMTQRIRPFRGALGHNYHGFATRGLGQMMRLGLSVYDASKTIKPAARSVMLVTNASDTAVNNTLARNVVQRWQANGMDQISTYEFDAKYHLIHDVIDPMQEDQQTALVYPILLDLITSERAG